jgi:hypothetical protein
MLGCDSRGMHAGECDAIARDPLRKCAGGSMRRLVFSLGQKKFEKKIKIKKQLKKVPRAHKAKTKPPTGKARGAYLRLLWVKLAPLRSTEGLRPLCCARNTSRIADGPHVGLGRMLSTSMRSQSSRVSSPPLRPLVAR